MGSYMDYSSAGVTKKPKSIGELFGLSSAPLKQQKDSFVPPNVRQ